MSKGILITIFNTLLLEGPQTVRALKKILKEEHGMDAPLSSLEVYTDSMVTTGRLTREGKKLKAKL